MTQTSTVESVGVAFLGAPFVGILAERVFGYVKMEEGTSVVGHDSVNEKNANALGYALFYTTVIPWAITILQHCVLQITFNQDSKREGKKHELMK